MNILRYSPYITIHYSFSDTTSPISYLGEAMYDTHRISWFLSEEHTSTLRHHMLVPDLLLDKSLEDILVLHNLGLIKNLRPDHISHTSNYAAFIKFIQGAIERQTK